MIYAKYEGISQETATLEAMARQHPSESGDEIYKRALRTLLARSESAVGCDLGEDAYLEQDEAIECYVRTEGMDRRPPDGIAIARDGALFIDDQSVHPRRSGKWLQAALIVIQHRVGHLSPSTGQPVSLNAWDHWFVRRDQRRSAVGRLRPTVKARQRVILSQSLEELGL